MTLKRVLILAAVALATLTGSARADITIDTFDTPAAAQLYELGGAVPSTFTNTGSIGAGITRTITVTQTQNTLGAIGATSGQYGGGFFTLGTDPLTTAYASLLYTYTAPQDLSVGGTVFKLQLGTDLGVPITARISDGTTTARQIQTVASGFNGIVEFDLSGFTGVQLTNVNSIEFLLNYNTDTGFSRNEADVALSDISVTNPTPPVIPAPPALVLMLAAAPALGLARRFARKA